ncbi:MAG: M28 family peptidase [Bacteroidia bacterium]|nr:M28 family peptidase [Bacteroidia bacterium]
MISHGAGRGDNGALTVSGAYFPIPPETPRGERPRAFSPNAPATLPQVSMLSEHYNRIFRTLEKGIKVKIELTLDVAFTTPEEGYNVIAEIPGTDLKDEVVMIGAHLDSWHSATGTTDNGAGSAVMLEAIRIMKSLGIQPRRTIASDCGVERSRAFWDPGGYVKKHLGERVGEETKFKPGSEKFSVYFNMDNGTGKFRGIYMQGNEGVRDIFREWFRPFNDLDAATLATFNTGGTDHLAFDGIGLPGFQFIQDPIEYRTRTHHTSLDGFDKAIPDDLKQNAVIVATFAWLAANRDELMPRK